MITMIHEVWGFNFTHEVSRIEAILDHSSYVAIDTEFPGFLVNTARDAVSSQRYKDLKYNVNHLKLIQLGLSFSDHNGNSLGTWQFNFCDFDPNVDAFVHESVALLEQNGINLHKNHQLGVSTQEFSTWFCKSLLQRQQRRRDLRWITFHGLYDVAYMIKVVKNKDMPVSMGGYLRDVGRMFCGVYDLKFMAMFCEGCLDGEIGLSRLADMLGVERYGEGHQAGSDSLLTMGVFWKMKVVFRLAEDSFESCLYGGDKRVHRKVALAIVNDFDVWDEFRYAVGCNAFEEEI